MESLHVEVLHVTQKSCNASVACTTSFLSGYRLALSLPSLKYALYHHNMAWVVSSASSAQILIIQIPPKAIPDISHQPCLRAEQWLTFPKTARPDRGFNNAFIKREICLRFRTAEPFPYLQVVT